MKIRNREEIIAKIDYRYLFYHPQPVSKPSLFRVGIRLLHNYYLNRSFKEPQFFKRFMKKIQKKYSYVKLVKVCVDFPYSNFLCRNTK